MLHLQRAIDVHQQWLAAGKPVPADRLLADHPDLAEFLQALLCDPTDLDRAVREADGDTGPAERTLGDFRVLGEIGRGGMGVVYRARQRSLDREVALKVLPHHLTLEATAIARFHREASLAARLEHPNIVAIHSVGHDADTHFFAMELVDGAPLARLDPTTGKPRTLRNCVELCAAVCDALAHAHDQGVLHRDVKPSNILVRGDGRPVLTDFGLARDVDEPGLTRTGAFAGTLHYASPEQTAGRKDIDARTDVWSLGATLYELLTGRPPFAGDSSAEVLERIARAEPPDPLRLVPELSPDLAAIVLKALEKDPARRYQTARAFGDDLRAFLEYRPVSARRNTRTRRLRRWVRREPLRAAFAAVLVLGVPSLSLAAGMLIANRAAIQVGAREIRRQEQEQRLARLTIDLEAGDYAAALVSANLAVTERPDDIEAHVLRALVQVYSGHEDEALPQLEAAIAERRLPYGDRARILVLTALHRTDAANALTAKLATAAAPEELFLDGYTATLRGQDRLMDVAEWQRVRDMFLRAMLVSPSRRLHYYLKWAAAVGWSGDAAATAQCNAVLLDLWPQSPAALLYVAFSLRRADPAKAAAMYRQVLQAGHDHPRIYTSIADCLENAKDMAGARRAREEALAAYDRRKGAGLLGDTEQLNLAITLFELGRLADATVQVRAVVARRPDMGRAHRLLGWLLMEARDFPAAIAALEVATQLDPKDADALQRLGSAQLQAGEPAHAITAYQRLCELLPNSPMAHHALGNAHTKAGDLAAALAANRRAAELAPKAPEFQLNLGLALRAVGDQPAALSALQKALVLRPNYPTARQALAELQEAAGDRQAAIATLRAGLEADAGVAWMWENLGWLQLRNGDAEAGRAALREAVARAVAEPTTIEFLRRLAAKAVAANDRELARTAWRRILDFEPTAAQRAEAERELAKLDGG